MILSQFAEGAWAIPGAMPSARKQTEISWHNSIVDNNDRVHLSQTGNKYVIHPRLDDAEVAGFEAAAIELLLDGDHDGMRRTPGPGHQAVSDQREGGEQLQMEGYNAWSGTNFMSGLINRAAIIDSPQKFSGRLSLTPLSIGPFVALKQPSSPEAVCGMQESKFVDKVIKTFSLVQDKSESPVDLSNKHADRESVLRELRASLLSLKPGENNISSCEAQNSYERDKEQADGPDCPMTAHAKVACKDFVREFRRLERLSAEQAQEYAESALESVPASARWRVHLQMADLAKRLNKEEEATEHYKEACKLEPTASKSKPNA